MKVSLAKRYIRASSYLTIIFYFCFFLLLTSPVVLSQEKKYDYIEGPNIGKEAYVPKEYADVYSIDINEYTLPWILTDRNADGEPDFATLVRAGSFLKKMEVLDLDYDGLIDDFTFYDKNGKVIYQIIDHNKDGKADVWVQVKQGKFIQRIQRDKNGDGLVDIDRVFDRSVLHP